MAFGNRLIKINEEGGGGIPTDSLLGFFKFDGNFVDETAQGNLQSTINTFTTGKFGSAWDLSSSTATASRTTTNYGQIMTSITSPSQSYSVSIWFNLSLLGRRNILWYVDRAIGTTAVEFSNNAANSQTQMYLPSPELRFVGPFLSTGVWNHFAATYNGSNSTSKYYLNNVELFSGVLNYSSLSADCFSHNAPTVGFRGLIDQSRFYSRVLTPAEITALYEEV